MKRPGALSGPRRSTASRTSETGASATTGRPLCFAAQSASWPPAEWPTSTVRPSWAKGSSVAVRERSFEVFGGGRPLAAGTPRQRYSRFQLAIPAPRSASQRWPVWIRLYIACQ